MDIVAFSTSSVFPTWSWMSKKTRVQISRIIWHLRRPSFGYKQTLIHRYSLFAEFAKMLVKWYAASLVRATMSPVEIIILIKEISNAVPIVKTINNQSEVADNNRNSNKHVVDLRTRNLVRTILVVHCKMHTHYSFRTNNHNCFDSQVNVRHPKAKSN